MRLLGDGLHSTLALTRFCEVDGLPGGFAGPCGWQSFRAGQRPWTVEPSMAARFGMLLMGGGEFGKSRGLQCIL